MGVGFRAWKDRGLGLGLVLFFLCGLFYWPRLRKCLPYVYTWDMPLSGGSKGGMKVGGLKDPLYTLYHSGTYFLYPTFLHPTF